MVVKLQRSDATPVAMVVATGTADGIGKGKLFLGTLQGRVFAFQRRPPTRRLVDGVATV